MEPVSVLIETVIATTGAVGASALFMFGMGRKYENLSNAVTSSGRSIKELEGRLDRAIAALDDKIEAHNADDEAFKREAASQWNETNRSLGRIEGMLEGTNPGTTLRRK